MNVLHINTIDIKGGAAKVAYMLKTELEKRGRQSSMFVKLKYSDDPEVHVMKWPNPLTRAIKSTTGKDVGSYLSNKIRPLLANDVDFFKSDRLLQTDEYKKADIVHCHNLHGNYFNLRTLEKIARDKPIVWTLHDMWAMTPYCAHTLDMQPANGFYRCVNPPGYPVPSWHNEAHLQNQKRKAYANAKFHIVTPCAWLKGIVEKSVLRNHPLSLIYNGIDTSVFKPYEKSAVRRELGLPQDKKMILFLSAIGQNDAKGWKHIQSAITHFGSDPHVLFLSVGGRGAGIRYPNLMHTNYIDDENLLAKYYSAADVFLFPSPAETFPLAVLESMACGLPVIAFDVGGIKEIIENSHSGYVVQRENTSDLLEKTKLILALNEQENVLMSRNGSECVHNLFSKDTMSTKYISLYEKLIKN